MRRTAILLAVAVLACFGLARPARAQQAAVKARACEPADGLTFICGLASVEDLVPVAGGRFLVGSSYKEGSAGLYLIDTAARAARPLRLSLAPRRDPRFGDCPAPDLARLDTHGLDAVTESNGGAIVYAVNHGGRESIEVFRLDAAAGRAAWIGCVLLPADASGNGVAALPGGGLALTKFHEAGDDRGIVKVFNREVNGLVYVWTPGRGFRALPGSRLSGDNGIAASRDGKWLFVNEYGRKRIWRLPLSGAGRPTSVAVPFYPDNLRWTSGGDLLVTGQFVTPDKLTELHDWATVRLDPRSMAVTPLLRQRALPAFDSATTAVEAGGMLWFGSFRGDRIAYRPIPRK